MPLSIQDDLASPPPLPPRKNECSVFLVCGSERESVRDNVFVLLEVLWTGFLGVLAVLATKLT